MFTVNRISKSFGTELILNDVSFTLNRGDRLGLIGPNGSGKTTLLRILAGELLPDSGTIQRLPYDLHPGYLPQGLAEGLDEPVGSFIDRMQGDVQQIADRLAVIAAQISADPDNPSLHDEYAHTLASLEASSESTGRTEAVLGALGLADLDRQMPIQHLSGGQKTRLALAGILLSNPQALLLDEPTNHLDFAMLAWLEEWLIEFQGAVLVVSHDRAFLDGVATGILELDPRKHTLRSFAGNYSAYYDEKLSEEARQLQAYQDQQDEIARLKRAAARMRSRTRFHKGGKADPAVTDGFSAGFFADRGKETIQKAKNIEKRVERLLNEDHIDKPVQSWRMKIEFGEPITSGRDVLVLEDAAVGYGENVLLKGLNLSLRAGARAVLVGPNGSGKTTLLRTVAGQIEPLAGKIRLGTGIRLGYMAQEQENLDPEATPLSTLARISALNETGQRALLSKYLFKGDDVFVPVGMLSYGERARLSLLSLVATGCNLLLLDEPVNHLDIAARSQFEQALDQFEGTILAVVHDRYFIAELATELWQVTENSIRQEKRLNEPLTA